MNVIYSVKLNVSEKNVLKPLIVKQKDSNSRYIDCAFFHGRFMLLVRSGSVAVNVTRSDGQIKSFAGSINENGTVRIPVANWMTEKAGAIHCDVSVYDGDEKLTSATFEIEVDPSQNPDGTVSPDDPLVDLAQQLVNRCEAAAEQIETEFGGAGIHDASYTTILDTTTATTSIHSNKTYPWIKVSSTEDLIAQNNFYRVTFDGVEYTMCADMWYSDNRNGKSTSLLGNATYWGDIDGFLYPINNVPFLISGLMSDGNTNTEGVFLFTETAGTHTIKIERASYDFKKIPPLLISGFPHLPVHLLNNGTSGYNGVSVGENIMKNTRSTFAIGTENEISAQLGVAIGQLNVISGDVGKAFGRGNIVSGSAAIAIGEANKASGAYSVAIGRQNTVSEYCAIAIGYYNTASAGHAFSSGIGSVASGGASTAIGCFVIANHLGQIATGMYNEADPSTASVAQRGNYIEIVGNGTGENARSNARTLDWDGNEALAGSITLGKGTEDEVTLTAADLKRLLALLS